ncbi:MAG: trehalase family glycosidase [Eubacteriales bacterium]|nr:trehalase family glycosidase [Eubacteriales bacterium]
MGNAYWIWYPGDFEVYHGMLQNFSREERGFRWPAYWHMDDCMKNVRYSRTYLLEREETFAVFSHAHAYVRVNRKKCRLEEPITCGPGEVSVEVYAGCPSGIPAIFVQGEKIFSDGSWRVDDFINEPVLVDFSGRYVRKDQNPSVWVYDKREMRPENIEEVNGGSLYTFSTEMAATLSLDFSEGFQKIMLCYGESRAEALDTENCYYRQKLRKETDEIPARAFRYLYIPNLSPGKVSVTAMEQYVAMPTRAFFACDNEKLNQIWQVAERTFKLCSGVFFLDGIKRDRWIWSGDAYQSFFVNQYLLFDEEISKRTLWALRGKDPIGQHINTIVDYSMYWLMGVWKHYEITGDERFVRMIYPRMCSMMDFLEEQTDEHGFLVGREGDWIFIDWADIDKTGAVCAEQILLAKCYEAMEKVEKLLKIQGTRNYGTSYRSLAENIRRFYWNEEKGAYIDSFASGKNHVSRHTNLFAILFGMADQEQTDKIYQKVLLNDEIPPITTPYFKFYELEALSKLGQEQEVLDQILSYWGGMLDLGAVTFWEEYDPRKQGDEHYEMYGDPYGKSLCHAWGASPIYLIGRYFMGISPTSAAYETFLVEPKVSLFQSFSCEFPLKDGSIKLEWKNHVLTVRTDKEGGTLRLGNQTYPLKANRTQEFFV